MKTKKTLLFSLLLGSFAAVNLYAMESDTPQGIKRTADGNEKKDSINNIVTAPEHPLINTAITYINNLNTQELGKLLSSHEVITITPSERDQLLKAANDYELTICAIVNQLSPLASKSTDQTIKDKFSFNEEYTKAKRNSRYTQAFKLLENFNFPQPLFSPQPYNTRDTRPTLDTILGTLIDNEQTNILVCCFHITLLKFAKKLVAQKDNDNVSVDVITNQKQGDTAPLDALKLLVQNDITVSSPQSRDFEASHEKFLVFTNNINNESLVWVGSYNITGHSNLNSWENTVILNDKNSVQKFIQRFNEIKTASKPITIEQLNSTITHPTPHSLKINIG